MARVFRIDRFVTWMFLNGSTAHQVRKTLEKNDWAKYDGMTYDEVKREEYAVMDEWFETEDKK